MKRPPDIKALYRRVIFVPVLTVDPPVADPRLVSRVRSMRTPECEYKQRVALLSTASNIYFAAFS